MLKNTKFKSDYDKVHFCSEEEEAYQEFRSAPKLLLPKEEDGHQDIKTPRHQDIKSTRHQDKTRRTSACFACLLGWILLGWILLGCYAWIGSENSVQDSQRNTPRCKK